MVKRVKGFEVVNIAQEYMAIPVGEQAKAFRGVVVLNEASAFLLKNMVEDTTIDRLVCALTEKYDVDTERARCDIKEMLNELAELGLVSI